jgi:hypothetical protein
MEYHRQTVNSNTLVPIFNLPESLRNRNVEVIVLPLDNESAVPANRKSAKGSLKKYANPALIPQEKGAWTKSADE